MSPISDSLNSLEHLSATETLFMRLMMVFSESVCSIIGWNIYCKSIYLITNKETILHDVRFLFEPKAFKSYFLPCVDRLSDAPPLSLSMSLLCLLLPS